MWDSQDNNKRAYMVVVKIVFLLVLLFNKNIEGKPLDDLKLGFSNQYQTPSAM